MDLDLGNYERYLDVTLSKDNNITTGKIYTQVIEREVSFRTFRLLFKAHECFSVKESIWERRCRWDNEVSRKSFVTNIAGKIVPHLVNAIQDWIERVSKIPVDDTGEEPDVCIVEVIPEAIFSPYMYA